MENPLSASPSTARLTSAVDLADAVRTGRRTAVDVVRVHLDRIAALDPELNAFQSVRQHAALDEAAAVDRHPDRDRLPLAGVPVGVKDNIAVAGVPTRHGSAATSSAPASADDELVARLRAAGCVVIGTTRMPELAAWPHCSSTAYGVTRNPWDPRLDPGGSTGGGAVAVRTGMVALAIGTDGGGSLRIPAAQCGVVGLKPSAGAVPLPGGAGEHWCGLTVTGPLARSVGDAAVAYRVLAGLATDPTFSATPGKARIALSLRSPAPFSRPDGQQRAAVDRAASILRAAGHEVVVAEPPYPAALIPRWSRRWWAGIALDADRLGVRPEGLEPRTRSMIRRGRRVLRFGGPRRAVAEAWRDRALGWLADFDLAISPAVGTVPRPAGALDGRGYLPTLMAAAKTAPYGQAWNLAGFPALVVPVGARNGLPMAVQLIGRPGAELELLAWGAQLEAEIDSLDQRSPTFA
jgi:amidase